LEKIICEREMVVKNFEKKKENRLETIKKMWEEKFGRDSGRKKDVGRKFKKLALWILPLYVAFFFKFI
jgi:hypothetical protein